MLKKYMQCLVVISALVIASSAFGLPFLQLDVSDGVYDSALENVNPTTNPFSLYTLIDPSKKGYIAGQTYYVSIAIVGLSYSEQDLGSFLFDGIAYDVTDDLTFGTPANGTLPGHNIFNSDAWYTEIAFTLPQDPMKTLKYNVQDDPGGLSPNAAGTLFYEGFSVNFSSLLGNYPVHFDLYTKTPNGDLDKFAPFSHDAQTAPVPEPATMLLFGAGLAGLAGVIRRKKN